MGKKHMLSMKKLEIFILKEVSHFEALKKCEEGIHKFKFQRYRNSLTCNKCNFEFKIPEDELKDYLIDHQPAKFWDDVRDKINDDWIKILKEKLLPLMNNALELLNPKQRGEELIKAARSLLDTPLMQVLSELDKKGISIDKVKFKCKFGEHLLTYEDPQSSFLPNAKDKFDVLSEPLQSKGIWCKYCGQLILSMKEDRWQYFKEGAINKIESQKLLIRRNLQEYFHKLVKYLAKIDGKHLPFFFVDIGRGNVKKEDLISQHENTNKIIIANLMQEVNSPEETEIKHRLGKLKDQQSQLGRELTALENLSYLYRIISDVFRDEFSKDPHVFFQSDDTERKQWHDEVKSNMGRIRVQMKELSSQKDAILYPDSEEHYDF
ncbi:MAG: hypothetical protein ACTSR8_13130 [Promethearchaeota archaeon]